MLAGRGVDALATDKAGVIVAQEIQQGFVVKPGDALPVTIFPDDEEKSRNINLHVAGVFRSVPPTDPPAELVVSAARFPPWLLSTPEFYLARVSSGHSAAAVARELRHSQAGRDFRVTTLADQPRLSQRSLTTLNLGGLSRIEAIGAVLIAAIGVAVLGAFVIIERRREFAILRTLGADTPHLLAGPAQEGAIVVAGSLMVGVPLGLGLAVLAVRVLALFFNLPPPLLALPTGSLAAFGLAVVGAAGLALGAGLLVVNRMAPASVLREP